MRIMVRSTMNKFEDQPWQYTLAQQHARDLPVTGNCDAHKAASGVLFQVALASEEEPVFASFCRPFAANQPLFSRFHHLIVVHSALFERTWRTPTFDSAGEARYRALCTFFSEGRRQIEQFLEETASVDAKTADRMREGVKQLPPWPYWG
jgi:hypothetical protein